MMTAGVEAMPLDQRRSLLQKIRSFEAFGEDNDPHAEHDFGALDEAGERFENGIRIRRTPPIQP